MPSQISGELFSRPFFGATVEAYCPLDGFMVPNASLRFFERGTINFQGILMLEESLASFRSLAISPRHAEAVVWETYLQLSRLHHATGAALLEIFGRHEDRNPATQGPTIAFLVKDQTEKVIPYYHVVRCARAAGITLRG